MLYEREVMSGGDIRRLHEYVTGDPSIEAYRGYLPGEYEGASYGWNVGEKTYIYMEGKHYFPNPMYSSSAVEITYSFDELLSSVEDKTVI